MIIFMGAHGRGRCVVALGMLLAGSSCAVALNPALDISQYAHTAWRHRDGFARGRISSITQTPDGYLWLGTEFGLLRFDGIRTVPWPPEQPLPSNFIVSLLTSRDGTLWIGTYKGLASWRRGMLTSYPELAGRMVTLIEDHEGTVWAGAGSVPTGRLCSIRNGTVQCHGEDGRFGLGVFLLYEYRSTLWAGAGTGLWRWTPDPPERYPFPQGEVRGLIEGDNGALWLAVRSGIRQFADGKAVALPLPASGPDKPNTMIRDREGGLWTGTSERGLWHSHQGRSDWFASADGLSGNSVSSLFEDREGSIWAATTDGLDRFRDFAVPTISIKQGLSSSLVTSVAAARDGSVWIGTSDGLNRWNRGQVTTYRKRGKRPASTSQDQAGRNIFLDGLPDNTIGSIFQDGHGRIWAATLRGIARYEDGRFVAAPIPAGNVRSIAEESPGNLWISHQDSGLFHLSGLRVVEQIPLSKLGDKGFVDSLAADPLKGGVWIGFFRGGVASWKDGQVRASYSTANGLGDGRVTSLQLEPDGTIWAATEGGLSRLKDGRAITLTSKNGLPCDTVHWMVEDDAHFFWLSMSCGLVRVARPELDSWAADPHRAIKATVFDSSDGMQIRALAAGNGPPFVKTPDGKLWFVTIGGVSVVDPSHIPFNNLPPPVHIEQVIADRKTRDANEGLRLPPLVRDLEIDYTALSLAAPEKVRFRYKLEGHDVDWQDVGARRQAFYTNLPPRNYRFRVLASNNSGVWNEAGAFLDFSVDPAYYQTTLFRVSCVAAFLAVLAGLYRLRLRQLAWQFNMRLEERVNERTRIARELHDTLLQSFQAVLMKFSAVAYMIKDPPGAQEKLEDVINQAREAITEGRDTVQGLRSSTLVTNDLLQAIRTFGESLAADHTGPNCPEFRVRVEGATRDLAPLIRDEVHRIACEAVRNAFRHAQAGRIEVEICYDRRQICVRVHDNGKGIDPKTLEAGGREGHHGLPGMQERAKLAGGKLALRSKLDSGTEVELTIPGSVAYTKAAAASKSN